MKLADIRKTKVPKPLLTVEERRELHLANSRRNMPKANERRRAKKLASLKEKKEE